LSWDGENDPDILGMIGASFALASSNIPWNGPLGAIRVGRIAGEFVFNPTYEQRKAGDMDLTLSALERDGDILINMIEMGAKEAIEKDFMSAYESAKPELKKLIDFQIKAVKKIGKEKDVFEPAVDLEMAKEIKEWLGEKLADAINNAPKGEKNLGATEILKQELIKYCHF